MPPRPVSWLWTGRIARWKVIIVAGNPGLEKSQVTASVAAVVTTGGRWPVDHSQCAPGDVLFLSADDDAADTLRPRLEAAGAKPVDGELQNWPKATWSNGVTEGNGRPVFKRRFGIRNGHVVPKTKHAGNGVYCVRI